MADTRPPAVAGMFYQADPYRLQCDVDEFLAAATARDYPVKALIVPHAGYVYSGPVAAQAYRLLQNARQVSRVILLGPAHYHYVHGIAVPSVANFETPLGAVRLDTQMITQLAELPQVDYLDVAHAPEHSLEVQLPFLQRCLGDFSLVPLLIGDATATQVGDVIDRVWGGPETLLLISSDLSHFHAYADARQLDGATSRAICDQSDALQSEQACGCRAINGLMHALKSRSMRVAELALANSGDTAGAKDRVVGYGAYVVY